MFINNSNYKNNNDNNNKKKKKKKTHAFFIHGDNSKRCSFRNLKKIVNKSAVLFAVNLILNFSKIQNFENPTLDTKRKKRKSFFNRFREHITGECTSLFH